MIDYKELLIKYIIHIENMEGYDFIDDLGCTINEKGIDFSKEEIAELKRLAKVEHANR